MKRQWKIVLAIAMMAVFLHGQQGVNSSVENRTSYVPVREFDENRNASADLQAGIAEAKRTGKRVLVDVGGDWCIYCRQMDELYKQHPELVKLRDEKFVLIAIFYSSKNKNEKALAEYPKPAGIPHFYVLDSDGKLLHSQAAIELRSGDAYDAEKMKQFFLTWAQVRGDP